MAVSSASPLNVNSAWPWKRGILEGKILVILDALPGNTYTYFHIMQFSAGAYFALPPELTFTSTLAEFKGVGILKITLLAYSLGEKLALTLILYSTRVFPISFTTGWTLNGRLTFSVVRYLVSRRVIGLTEKTCSRLVSPVVPH